jgi:ferrous iron transport protein B
VTTAQPQIDSPAEPTGSLRVVLVGNPNTGKSTLFNRLTGIRQRVGNYPGVTVEKKHGSMPLGKATAELIDLPGTYSLVAESRDERVVTDVFAGRFDGDTRPDAVICVVDATNLKRNLFLASQIADTGLPMVIALNMADAARNEGVHINHELLAERLGVPVVSTVAAQGVGVKKLKKALEQVVSEGALMNRLEWPESVRQATALLDLDIRNNTGVELTDAELRRLLFDMDSAIVERIGWDVNTPLETLCNARQILKDADICVASGEAILRYRHLDHLLEGVVTYGKPIKANRTEAIDKLLTHRVFGLGIFTALMYIVFQSIYTWAGPAMDLIEAATAWSQNAVAGHLESTPVLQSLVVDGVIAGIGGVLIFLPQILILFFFISFLEDTGYMARAAFLMDRLFGWCGLNGKSFVPMLSSFACAIPGVMGARTINEPRARLTTILIAPLMSCSARLPVYVLLIGAFIHPQYGALAAGFTLFVMHIVGLTIAMPIAFILNRFILKTHHQPFVLEMPPYRMPKLRDVIWRMWERGSEFVMRAGTIILAMSIIIWALLYFPRPLAVAEQVKRNFVTEIAAVEGLTEQQILDRLETEAGAELADRLALAQDAAFIEQSLMGRAGKTIQPIFAPAGFDWKITVGVLAAFPAREVIISTLGIIYSLGDEVDEESEGLTAQIQQATWSEGPRAGQPVFTPLVAVALMVFFALCSQCGSTLAIIARETSWRWAVVSFTYMTTLAWLGAVVVYQVGSWFV